MKKWWGAEPVRRAPFETQQSKLQQMNREVVRRYQWELDAEINDPQRLAAVYGSSFASTDAKRQAEVVCLMATSMLKVPNCEVNLVLPDRQVAVAAVHHYEILTDTTDAVPLSESFCKHVIGTGREFAVDDSEVHQLVCDTRLARNGDILSYLGVPVANRDSVIVGVLCTFDAVARNWGPADVSMLTQLSFVLTRTMDATTV